MVSRRALLAGSLSLAATRALADRLTLPRGLAPGVAQSGELASLPGKRPLLRLSHRPPNYETPLSYFDGPITPNDAFFVRYHLDDIPLVDPAKWRLSVSGGAAPLSLSLEELKQFPAVEITAVCQCSGNRRGLSDPHVAGVEWGYGAMGCARWKGARLKDVLAKAGVPPNAVEVVMNGADGPVLDKTPDFVKSLPLWKAMDENTLIAYEMNGAPLPHFNGAPARVIAPGWTATYWMKHIAELAFSEKPFDGFWMAKAYRIPIGLFPAIDRFLTQENAASAPITEIMVNSLITAPADGAQLARGPLTIAGLAWDSGRGVASVEISTDKGAAWREAKLGEDVGRFGFRAFTFEVEPAAGALVILSRASNNAGQSQVAKPLWNPAGYHHNAYSSVTVSIA
ncbi:MAG: molybdopterin-dependent oxidoreductase [Pseudomonadota bacterium]|nr:molybdopterin-dependent oxidoreductase [Pseudomonadota bacterium]